MANIAINGFGRIGRHAMRIARGNKDFNVVAINDIDVPTQTLAHMLKYDSVHGIFPGEVTHTEKSIVVDGKEIPVYGKKDPSELPWKDLKVDVVLECTGKFTEREGAQKHLNAGARKVIISAPAKNPDLTVVLGINENLYDKNKHNIISNASCTTNCLAPVVKIIDEAFGIEHGLMTTIHSYTNDQKIMDQPHKDLRRSRAGAMSQIITSTGAAKAIGEVLPHLKGKLDGLSVRVPTPDVSLVDFTVQVKKTVTKEQINAALKEAAHGKLKGILDYNELPLVSQDYIGNRYSSIVDGLSTSVMNGNMVKVLSWYDNEIGYSSRLVECALLVAK